MRCSVVHDSKLERNLVSKSFGRPARAVESASKAVQDMSSAHETKPAVDKLSVLDSSQQAWPSTRAAPS